MRYLGRGRFSRWVVVLVLTLVSPATASTNLPGGRSLQTISNAPWVFLGQVTATEIKTDHAPRKPSQHPSSPQIARFTQFHVLRKIKGPAHEGETITLKECTPNAPGSPLCGSLYAYAHNYQIGDQFLVFTGPGKARADGYQSAVLLPASQVPLSVEMKFPPGKEPFVDEEFEGPPSAPSGWLINLSDLTKKETLSEKYDLTLEEAKTMEQAGPVDLGVLIKLIHKMGKMGPK